MHNSVIQRLREGYSNGMRSKGVSQSAATQVSFNQVQQICIACRQRCVTLRPTQQLHRCGPH